MLQPLTATVTLGEREYIIAEAPRLRAGPWRKRLVAEVKPLFDQLAQVQGVTFDTPADLVRVWPVLESLLLTGVDSVFELLILYSAELEADRAYIEAHATERQIMAAFWEVVRLGDPFGMVAAMNGQIGRNMSRTS